MSSSSLFGDVPASSTSRRQNVLLGLTGSVATVKWPQIVLALRVLSSDIRVKIVLTSSARHFFAEVAKAYDPTAYEAASALLWTAGPTLVDEGDKVQLFEDADEWSSYRSVKEDSVLHIELRRWAHVLLIAPCSANTLGKLANGLCDNLLTCVARAWDYSKPLILCPSMNTAMYVHPVTARQLAEVKSFSGSQATVVIVDPVTKMLACGDVGTGALAPVEAIVKAVQSSLSIIPSASAGSNTSTAVAAVTATTTT